MIVTCIRCKKKFDDGGRTRRFCGNHNRFLGPQTKEFVKDYPWRLYVHNARRYYLNPIYQYFRMFNSEQLGFDGNYGLSKSRLTVNLPVHS